MTDNPLFYLRFVVAVLGLLFAMNLSGCGQECPVSAKLQLNDIGVPYLLQFKNNSNGKITVEKVTLNGQKNLTEYVVGLFQRGGQLPAELAPGEVVSLLVFPYSVQTKINDVMVSVDGKTWEISFATY